MKTEKLLEGNNKDNLCDHGLGRIQTPQTQLRKQKDKIKNRLIRFHQILK
jgi:hypothetical protein